tara:strand:+ start:29164 stop:29337 length:174 start_codon:yes stop_codon:yes gene_type:complete
MKVNLQRDWSNGEGRFRERNNPNTIHDKWFDQLPSDAEVVEPPKKAEKPKKAKKEDK